MSPVAFVFLKFIAPKLIPMMFADLATPWNDGLLPAAIAASAVPCEQSPKSSSGLLPPFLASKSARVKHVVGDAALALKSVSCWLGQDGPTPKLVSAYPKHASATSF